MTKAELEQYRSIAAEIDEIRDRLNKNTVHGTVTGSDSEFPYVKHCISVGGVEETERSKRDMLLIQRLERQKREIECFVHNIPDSITRRIFTYRYIDGRVKPSWQWIAFKIRHYDESYPRRKHNKYLKRFESAENAEK
ncbi:hypothetical protein FMM68_09790 [Lachnospiraceae bacterium MD329]|nr:hypothetical protein [Lachnospiraceae bacterium MD329]